MNSLLSPLQRVKYRHAVRVYSRLPRGYQVNPLVVGYPASKKSAATLLTKSAESHPAVRCETTRKQRAQKLRPIIRIRVVVVKNPEVNLNNVREKRKSKS
ncbi:hypothetical protein KQX54_004498 [Cotesia glomerata]|uniref:Uncharacterized protein n=1 Tax=Cotesia glomerata TaxID=32391 RepID=A0AAV7J538_COTGL|nr:hypothetical protein KQX54_004498 [Cotesia glomerata]